MEKREVIRPHLLLDKNEVLHEIILDNQITFIKLIFVFIARIILKDNTLINYFQTGIQKPTATNALQT